MSTMAADSTAMSVPRATATPTLAADRACVRVPSRDKDEMRHRTHESGAVRAPGDPLRQSGAIPNKQSKRQRTQRSSISQHQHGLPAARETTRTGPSLIPSPTNSTVRPAACSARILASLSPGCVHVQQNNARKR